MQSVLFSSKKSAYFLTGPISNQINCAENVVGGICRCKVFPSKHLLV